MYMVIFLEKYVRVYQHTEIIRWFIKLLTHILSGGSETNSRSGFTRSFI